MITNISLVTVYCLDQDQARDFYVDVLGFSPRTDVTMDDGYRWVTGGSGFPLVVSRGEMPRTISRIRDERRPWSVRCGQNTDPPSRWPAP